MGNSEVMTWEARKFFKKCKLWWNSPQDYVDYSEHILEGHVGEEDEKGALDVGQVLDAVILSLVDQRNQAGNELHNKGTPNEQLFIAANHGATR